MANAKAAFILPTSGSGVNGPSLTASWNSATYQMPVQASVAELEDGQIGRQAITTTAAILSPAPSTNLAREIRLKNTDATDKIRVATSSAKMTANQYWELGPGDSVVVPTVRLAELWFASSANTPVLQWWMV